MSKFSFSKKSLDKLHGVDDRLVKVIHRALELSTVDFGVREGVRTLAEQQELYDRGRKKPGKIVTWTMESKHIKGQAVDLYPSILPDGWQKNPRVFLPMLIAVKKAGDELGVKLTFGINWKNDPSLPIETKNPDAPHIELDDHG